MEERQAWCDAMGSLVGERQGALVAWEAKEVPWLMVVNKLPVCVFICVGRSQRSPSAEWRK